MSMNPHFLTVAGAAPESGLLKVLTGFPFHPARKTMHGHHERAGV